MNLVRSEGVTEAALIDAINWSKTLDDHGIVASYIPELSQVSPLQVGVSICLPNGRQLSAGHSQTKFSVQSISKVFTLSIALGRLGNNLWTRVGREPSTHVFNSVQELETRNGHPPNPFVNAGALVTTDALLIGGTPKESLAEILTFVRTAASDKDIHIDKCVAKSESETADHNIALAHLLKSYGNLTNTTEVVLGTYFHHCAISMNCEQLARFGRLFAALEQGVVRLSDRHIQSINALMMTCGHYQGSGLFAYQVGIPAKSGVGGGILAILPGKASIAVWAPGLNQHGNSKLGISILKRLSHAFNWSLFRPKG